jgi:quinol monooxygenase YgiN
LEEPETPVWYAIRYPGTNKFGIVDFFSSEQGRNAHLTGKVAAALFASVDELLTGTPDLVKVDVVAAKV